MEEISVKIKEASWYEVMHYLKTNKKRECKSELYNKLSKLYETHNRAVKLSRNTWFENCGVPATTYKHAGELGLDDTKLKQRISILNGTIYQLLMNLDGDIMQYMIEYYSLTYAYNQASKVRVPSMFDKGDIKFSLKKNMDKNIFENKIVANNVIWACRYILALQELLQKLKSIQNNGDIEKMLKLVHHTISELKQIVYDLDCKLIATSTSEIEIAKQLPDGTDKTLYCIETGTNIFR